MKVYKKLAVAFQEHENCIKVGNTEWEGRWYDTIQDITEEYLPNGSGFNAGTSFQFNQSEPERLVLFSAFQVMNAVGGYIRWVDFNIVVTPSLSMDFKTEIKILESSNLTLREVEDPGLLDYIGEVFAECLNKEYAD